MPAGQPVAPDRADAAWLRKGTPRGCRGCRGVFGGGSWCRRRGRSRRRRHRWQCERPWGRGLHGGVGATRAAAGGGPGSGEAQWPSRVVNPARARAHVVADPQVDGGDAGRLLPRRPPGCPEHGGGGRSAVRAVIPATVIRWEGCPARVARVRLRARRALSTRSRGVASGIAGTGVRSADDRDGSGPDGRHREVVTVDVETGDRDEERSRVAVAGVVTRPRHLGVVAARGSRPDGGGARRAASVVLPPTPDSGRPFPRTPRARRRWCGT